MSNWIIWTSLFFFALTSVFKGRTKSIALCIYFWWMAGIIAFGAWHQYQTFRQWALIDPGNIYGLANGLLGWVWFESSLAVLLVVLPVAWYKIDSHREKSKGDQKHVVSLSGNLT
jgi:hypothetical protein